ncbi:unnamed protein product (macronuclear) [Paramecium tetraurelia]|uniref:Transmembrane protein n=1 Tax=Paramecium tetraurelia TaxID=5888 RepID=A0CUH1_PARTE|nr:uncharacterized protein GSPATT00010638001 [Paramecium tetraurelia]CAK74438.1 unnamed protein product [Paramecium tetraurelia]|eukprot:XP_001441835.1 hypothetical protein (macronuclear) [Paramecium tetraurelia strain d4-2]
MTNITNPTIQSIKYYIKSGQQRYVHQDEEMSLSNFHQIHYLMIQQFIQHTFSIFKIYRIIYQFMLKTPLRERKSLFDNLLQRRRLSTKQKSRRLNGIYLEGIRAPLDSRIQKSQQQFLKLKQYHKNNLLFIIYNSQ